jgi:hypothetical protein
MDLADAVHATEVTLRILTDYLDVQQSVLPPAPEPSGPPCAVAEDCTGAWTGADCVDDTCYVPKNRYLSIDPTVNALPVAYQVEITEAVDYPDAEGRTWWVDEPQCYDYPDGNVVLPKPETCDGVGRFGWVSKLTATPVERIWTEVPLHMTECPVAPVVTFAVRATDDGGVFFSEPLVINTIHKPPGLVQSWGDVCGGPVGGAPGSWYPPDGAAGFDDISNAIRTFENRLDETGFPPHVWVDMEIDQVVNFADLQHLITAFAAAPYASINLPLIGVDPIDCP